MSNSLLFLIGMPACGKTTIGKLLSKYIEWYYHDLDEWIEHKANIGISKIFSQHGEAYFRKLELQGLNELSSKCKQVISLGGGTLEQAACSKIIQRSGLVCFIDVSPDILLERLDTNPTEIMKRPLLCQNDDYAETMTKLYQQRYSQYNQYADIVLRPEANDTPIITAIQLISLLRSYDANLIDQLLIDDD